MNINDYKHPAARSLDEMISGRLSMTAALSKIVGFGPDVWQLVLRRLPKENLRQLARQVYLDLRNDVRLDVLRGALWRQSNRLSIDLPILYLIVLLLWRSNPTGVTQTSHAEIAERLYVAEIAVRL